MQPLIGQGELLDATERALDAVAIVTLVGPGGIGKTTLARAVVARRGGLFVDLSAAHDRDALIGGIARKLGVGLAPGQDRLTAKLAHQLREHGGPIVLDNLEQVLADAAEIVAELVQHGAPPLLATSRQPLSVPGERALRVTPLPVEHARMLFLTHADAEVVDADRDQHAIDAVLATLGGNPLAVKLAAGRTPLEGLDRIRAALEHGRELSDLTGEHPDRHASMDVVVQSSWELLGPVERDALRTLSAFDVPFRLEDAVACGVRPQSVMALLRASLLHRDSEDGDVLLRLLDEVNRWMRKEQPPEDAVLATHDRWIAQRAGALADRFGNSGAPPRRKELGRLIPSLQAIVSRRESRPGSTLGDALYGLVVYLGHYDQRGCAELAARVGPALSSIPWERRAEISSRLAGALRRRGRKADGEALVRSELDAARVDGETLAEVVLLTRLANIMVYSGKRLEADAVIETALPLAREVGDGSALARALRVAGSVRRVNSTSEQADRFGASQAALRECIRLADVHDEITVGAVARAHLLMCLWDAAPAEALAAEACEMAARLEDPFLEGVILACLITTLLDFGAFDRARAHWPLYEARTRRSGDLETLTHMRSRIAVAGIFDQSAEDAAADLLEALSEIRRLEVPRYRPWVLAGLGLVAHAEGRLTEAIVHYADAAQAGQATQILLARDTALRLRHIARLQLGEPVEDDLGDDPLAADIARFVQGALGAAALREALDCARAEEMGDHFLVHLGRALIGRSTTWTVAEDGSHARSPAGSELDLTRRSSARRILARLARARVDCPGEPLPAEALIDAGWPGERILPDAARGRLYAAIRDIRKLGLGDVLQTHEGGYRLDPEIELAIG